MPKLSMTDWRGRVQPGTLTRVGGSTPFCSCVATSPLCAGLFATSNCTDTSPLQALEAPSTRVWTSFFGTQAWRSVLDSVVEDPATALVLASKISERMVSVLIRGPYSFASDSLWCSSSFELPSISPSRESTACLAFFGSEG